MLVNGPLLGHIRWARIEESTSKTMISTPFFFLYIHIIFRTYICHYKACINKYMQVDCSCGGFLSTEHPQFIC